MFRCQNTATLGNLTEAKIVVRSPQPSDIGKLLNKNVLNERRIKVRNKNRIQGLRGRVHELNLGGINGSVLGLGGQLNIPTMLIFSVWVISSLQVNQLGMGINLLYQLSQTSCLLLISNNGGLLGGSREARKRDLV